MFTRSALASLVLLTACSGPADRAAAPSPQPSAAATVSGSATCPAPPAAELTWPESVPSDLPIPPGARLTGVEDRPDGLTVVKFTTPIGIRDGVLFLIEQMPAAGYTLARGDAENTEADAPFIKGDLRGVMRMIAVQSCRTDWLMALATSAPGAQPGPPLLPPRPDASPLPFG